MHRYSAVEWGPLRKLRKNKKSEANERLDFCDGRCGVARRGRGAIEGTLDAQIRGASERFWKTLNRFNVEMYPTYFQQDTGIYLHSAFDV